MKHELKIAPTYFELRLQGFKDWELRYNDRNYSFGDLVVFKEWNGTKYTGREELAKITYILEGHEGLENDWCIFSTQTLMRNAK